MLQDTPHLVVIGVGLTLGLILARYRLTRLMLVLYHVPYRFWRSYQDLYDIAESNFTYKMIGQDLGTSRPDFLRKYHGQRLTAERDFRAAWNAFAWQVVRDYGIAILLGLGLFWSEYLFFLAVLTTPQLVVATYLCWLKQYRLDFFVLLMIRLISTKKLSL